MFRRNNVPMNVQSNIEMEAVQRTGAVQDLTEVRGMNLIAKRLGVRQSSAAFDRN
jgi:hypothetical protein